MAGELRRTRSTVLIGLLIASGVVTAVLALESYRAVNSQRAVARGVLQDYVEFAGWEFSRVAEQRLAAAASRALMQSRHEYFANVIGPRAMTQMMPMMSAA